MRKSSLLLREVGVGDLSKYGKVIKELVFSFVHHYNFRPYELKRRNRPEVEKLTCSPFLMWIVTRHVESSCQHK